MAAWEESNAPERRLGARKSPARVTMVFLPLLWESMQDFRCG